jgi:hypothetical protein
MKSLWAERSKAHWQAALARYPGVIEQQGVARLAELDHWYRDELPGAIAARRPASVTLAELVRLTEWKMARGVWRGRNLALVRGNEPGTVTTVSAEAMAATPHATAPISTLVKLDGIGPATASAVLAAYAPRTYPFFDELVAAQVPGLGVVAWTLGYYARYADALRARAAQLGDGWTPVMVERALWSYVGGKAGN